MIISCSLTLFHQFHTLQVQHVLYHSHKHSAGTCGVFVSDLTRRGSLILLETDFDLPRKVHDLSLYCLFHYNTVHGYNVRILDGRSAFSLLFITKQLACRVYCDFARLHLLHKSCRVDFTLGSPDWMVQLYVQYMFYRIGSYNF